MKSGQISTLIKEGRAYKSSSFLFKTAKIKDFDVSTREVAFLAPKKQFKTAVLRNKARRRIRAALNAVFFDLKTDCSGCYFLFSLYPGILTVPFGDLKEEVRHVLQKSDILVHKI
jgi:ribonuclease P protein component